MELLCNAYEEFLTTKVLPQSQEDMERMSQSWMVRLEQRRKEKARKDAARIKKMMNRGTSDAAIMAALQILQEQKPELLLEEYRPVGTEEAEELATAGAEG